MAMSLNLRAVSYMMSAIREEAEATAHTLRHGGMPNDAGRAVVKGKRTVMPPDLNTIESEPLPAC